MPLGVYAKGTKSKRKAAPAGSPARTVTVDKLATVAASAPLKAKRRSNPGASSLGMR